MIISLRLSEVDGVLLKKYAEYHNETVSAFIRRLAMEQIERDYGVLRDRCEKYVADTRPKPPVKPRPKQTPQVKR